MPEYILGMEPESVAKQMIRNYRATMGPEILTRDLDDRDCLTLMLEFNRHLVELNEVLQRQVLDKLGTTLPAPILAASGPSLREKEPESMDLRGALAAAKIALHMFTNTPAEADSQRRMVFRLDPNDYLQIRQSEEAVAQALAASAPPKTEASK